MKRKNWVTITTGIGAVVLCLGIAGSVVTAPGQPVGLKTQGAVEDLVRERLDDHDVVINGQDVPLQYLRYSFVVDDVSKAINVSKWSKEAKVTITSIAEEEVQKRTSST